MLILLCRCKQEREDAKTFFKSKKGKDIRKEITSNRNTADDDLDEIEETSIPNGTKVTPVRRG